MCNCERRSKGEGEGRGVCLARSFASTNGETNNWFGSGKILLFSCYKVSSFSLCFLKVPLSVIYAGTFKDK